MLIDLISTDNMISFNIKIAEVLGLNTAIYLNELMNIAMKAVRKKKLVADKFFIVDRSYVKSRTTISLEEQLAIDKKMVQMNIIQKANGGADEDSIYVDFELLAKMLSTDDEATLAKIGNRAAVKTLSTPGSKITAREREKELMKTYITVTHPELRQAFMDWIDGVYAQKNQNLSRKAVTACQQNVDKRANGDLDVALKILEIGTIYGHRNIDVSIDIYNNMYATTYRQRAVDTSVNRRVAVGDEVF